VNDNIGSAAVAVAAAALEKSVCGGRKGDVGRRHRFLLGLRSARAKNAQRCSSKF